MAYGLKYSGTFSSTVYDDLASKNYIIKLLFEGYSGNPSTILVDGFSEKDKSYGDGLIGIKGVKFMFGVVSNTLGVDDFYPESERHVKVELYSVVGASETLVRAGFLIEEDAKIEYGDGYKTIVISATDGLELLKGNKYFDDNEKNYNVYPYSERVSILTIIRRCFEKIGTGLNLNTAFNMHHGTTTPSAIFDILAYSERGQKDLIGKSCYEVLRMMAESLNCQIFQESGEWWFVHLLGQRYGGQFKRKWSTVTGDYISGGGYNNISVAYGGAVQPLGGGVVSLYRSHKRIISEVKLEDYSNGLLNSTFVASGSTYASWGLNSLSVSNGGTGTKIDPYYLQINNAQAGYFFNRVDHEGVWQDVVIGDVAAGDSQESVLRKQIKIKGRVLSGGCKTALVGVYLILAPNLIYYLSLDGNWNLVDGSVGALVPNALANNGSNVKRSECIEVNLIDKDGLNFTKYSEFEILSETVKEASDSKYPWYLYGIGGAGFSGVKGIEETDITKAIIQVVLYKGLEETDVVLATPYVRFADIDLQVIDALVSQRSESLKYVQETSSTSSRELKIDRYLIDFDDKNQVLAITSNNVPTTTWVTLDDNTPRELVEHLNKEILYVTNLPQKVFDGDLKGFPSRYKLANFPSLGICIPVTWNFDFKESIANGIRYHRLWTSEPNFDSYKYGIMQDGREVPFGDNGIPTILTNDDDVPRKGSPINSTRTGVISGNLIIDKSNSSGALNFINSAGLVTDYLRPVGSEFYLKANSGTEELIATDANAWMHDGNTIGVKKTIGSLDAFDVGIIRNSVEIVTILSTGATITGKMTATSAAITGLTTNYLPKAGAAGLLGDSLIYDDGTNIGIGTSSPSACDSNSVTLQLKNSVIIQNVVGTQGSFSNNAYYDGDWKRVTANGFPAAVRMNYDSLQTGISFHVAAIGAAGTTLVDWDGSDIKMRINNDGKVGIGTKLAALTYKLEVNADVSFNGVLVGRGGGNDLTNTRLGAGALSANTNGSNNTASGYQALKSNTTGNENTATGRYALYSNTTAGGNTASGYAALFLNTTGFNNTASGYRALRSNTTGYQNTASGYGALQYNTTGNSNTAIGLQALFLNTGGATNVGLGTYSGYDITTGSENVLLGYSAGRGITTGSGNTVLGYNITGLSATLANTLILGAGGRSDIYATATGVGIGVLSPAAKLDVSNTTGNLLKLASNGVTRTTVTQWGVQEWYLNTGAGEIGKIAYSTPGGKPGIIMYTGVGADENRLNFVNYGTYAEWRFDALSTGNGITLMPSGRIGIGTINPAAKLHIVGDITVNPLTVDANGSASDSDRALNFNVSGVNYGKITIPSGSGGAMAFWTGGANVAAERVRIDVSGNVGIGSINPSSKLSVTPTQYSTGTASQSLTTVTGAGTTFTSAMVGSQFVFANGVSAGTITVFTSATELTVSTSQTVALQSYDIAYTGLQVASSGNVGIGTDSPQSALQVGGITGSNFITLGGGSAGASYGINWAFQNAGANIYAQSMFDWDTRATRGFQTNSNYPISFNVISNTGAFSSNIMTMLTNGKVIIGNTGTTSDNLEVYTKNSVWFSSKSGAGNTDAIRFLGQANSGNKATIIMYSPAATYHNLSYGGGTGLGEPISNHYWYTGTVGALSAGTIKMSLLANGNVGIGLTPTTYKLEVNADVSFNGVLVGRGGGAISTNTRTGAGALSANTTGVRNTASGNNALYSNTTGDYNTASGYAALQSNTTADYNTSFGYAALISNITGAANTAIGLSALYSNTTGSYNTASGIQALEYNTIGYQNTAIGNLALKSNTTGYYNTASGSYALNSNTTANFNTASGSYALNLNTTGDSNTAIGYGALESNTEGYNNTAIGRNANVSSGSLFNATAIGFGASVNVSNKIQLGNGSVTSVVTSGVMSALSFTSTSDKRIKNNIIDGDLGLDFITKLRPVKYNMVNPADYPEELLEKRFQGKSPNERPQDNTRLYDGFIAQEVEEVLKSLNLSFSGVHKSEDGMYSLSYSDFIMPIVNSIIELSNDIEKLKKSILNK